TAFYRRSDRTIHLGPAVKSGNFDRVFAHELVHVVFHQKYKGAIPQWLEEGLANHVSGEGIVDYRWLAKQPYRDVTTLSPPFHGDTDPDYDYAASTALVEMISKRCSLSDLLQLSVGKKLESYLATFCEIHNVNRDLWDWIAKKAKE